MWQLENALSNILDIKPNYMRPPYGAIGGNTLSTLSEMGYEVVNWDVDTADWNADVETCKNLVRQAGAGGDGHIVLMHETYQTTVEQLVPWILDYAQQNGLEFVTVADCVGYPTGAYSAAEAGDGSWNCW